MKDGKICFDNWVFNTNKTISKANWIMIFSDKNNNYSFSSGRWFTLFGCTQNTFQTTFEKIHFVCFLLIVFVSFTFVHAQISQKSIRFDVGWISDWNFHSVFFCDYWQRVQKPVCYWLLFFFTRCQLLLMTNQLLIMKAKTYDSFNFYVICISSLGFIPVIFMNTKAFRILNTSHHIVPACKHA